MTDAPAYQVQDHWATSYEYNFAVALDFFRIKYEFQVPYGMIGARGSFWIDFMVWGTTRYPFRTPVEVQGEYWHTGRLSAEDQLKLDILKRDFGNVVEIWGEDVETIDAAKDIVRREIL